MNRMVTGYLEVAELQAMNRVPMYMKNWVERLDQFLSMTGGEILDNAGSVSRTAALEKAHNEYESFKMRKRNEPTEVEKDFVEIEKKMKTISSSKK